MSEELELKLLRELESLRKENDLLRGIKKNSIPVYSYSKILYSDLIKLVTIKKSLDDEILYPWIKNKINLNKDIEFFLEDLISENSKFIQTYNEEDLKVNFIIPLLNKVKFKSIENEFRSFYEHKLTYKTEEFIFNGTTDFLVSKGLFYSEKPYFFIQEFKKSKENSDPEPQLLAELISAIELNNWKTIKGAYIIGENWNFVVLNRLDKHKYKYFVSRTYNCTNFEDLKGIYQNLLFVKQEITEMVKRGE